MVGGGRDVGGPAPPMGRESLNESSGIPSVPSMLFSCVRCSTPASSLMTFQYDERAVSLTELETDPVAAHGYALCTSHADRMTPPLGWTLTDRRNVTRLFAPQSGVA